MAWGQAIFSDKREQGLETGLAQGNGLPCGLYLDNSAARRQNRRHRRSLLLPPPDTNAQTMNKIALLSLLSLSTVLVAQATEGDRAQQPTPATTTAKITPPKAKKAPAEAALVEKFVNLQDAAIATFLELGDTLRGVKDKEGADAAAPAVRIAGEQLYTIISAVEALGDPSEAAQQAIMARVANVAEKNRIVEQVLVPLLTLMMQEPPCYGSEALQLELSNLLANLQGAAGVEEGEPDTPTPLQEPDADEQNQPQ